MSAVRPEAQTQMRVAAQEATSDARTRGGVLGEIYGRLDAAYGGETWHWYPEHVRGPMDIVAGAILVQHTNWQNAERALQALRDATGLDSSGLASMRDDELVDLIRTSGTPTIKARRLRAVATTILDAGGIEALFTLPTNELRARLLATHGIGPETADAIMLYAASRPVFMVDAYTQRLFRRLGLGPDGGRYDAWQRFFEDTLESNATTFQRYHAYIVLHAKTRCRVKPSCDSCPLLDLCPTGRAVRTPAELYPQKGTVGHRRSSPRLTSPLA